jgi:hypothetical protein
MSTPEQKLDDELAALEDRFSGGALEDITFSLPDISGVISGGTLEQTSGQRMSGAEDPFARRFAYAPGVHMMEIEQRLSGRQDSFIPQGVLIKFESTPLVEENVAIDKPNWSQFLRRRVPALEFLNNVRERFYKPGLIDVGFRELSVLTTLSDEESATLFAVLHPSLEEVKIPCPQGLKVCPTCRLKWLTSDACEARMNAAIRQGVDGASLDGLLEQLADSCTALLGYYKGRWSEIVGEYEKRLSGADSKGLVALQDGEHHIRKCLHEVAPADRQAQVADAYGAATAQKFAEAMTAQGNQIAEAMREIGQNRSDDGRVAQLEAQLEEMRANQERLLKQFEDAQAAQTPAAETVTEGEKPKGRGR